MIKVRCSMVASPNGYIARLDGSEDWISNVNWTDYLADVKKCRNFVVGRETFEIVMKLYKDYNFDNVDAKYKLIVSHDKNYTAPKPYIVVHSPQEAVDYLAGKGIDEVLLSGGGKLNAAFATDGLIDELEVIFDPYVIGEGRQFLAPGNYEFSLKFKEIEELSKGRVRILYDVTK